MNAKITPEHTRRLGIVYVRQSTTAQVRENRESQRRQYALADHARALGFQEVEVIDQDLGHSGRSLVGRLGFQRLVAQVSMGSVGGVFCLEASRLARNNRDWHHLIDLCGLVGTLLIDPDGIYDPRLANDRLLLGLKGTMSEFELTLFRQRSLEARRQKAKRGELRVVLPVGLRWTSEGRIEKVPDQRVQEILDLAFRKFYELGSMRQTLIFLREQQIEVPKTSCRRHDAKIEWALPTYASLHSVLTNPFYAGAYVFGRTTTRTVIEGDRARSTSGHAQAASEWTALIRDHHPGYITWEQYERGQQILAENANMKGRMATGAPRDGAALLAGLLRCGRCGRKFSVHYSGKYGTALYRCRGANYRQAAPACLSLRGRDLDQAMEEEILKVIEPGAIQAALAAAKALGERSGERVRAAELELEQSRYEAERCFRQYDASDPENRLVTGELERRWNEALGRVRQLEQQLVDLQETRVRSAHVDAGQLLDLAADLPRVWHDLQTDMRLKKRIVRTLVEEILVDLNPKRDVVQAVIHWKGGVHSTRGIRKRRSGQHRHVADEQTARIIAQMAERFSDEQIALALNRLGLRTGTALTWRTDRVSAYRSYHQLPAHNPEASVEQLTLKEAAAHLDICPMTLRRLIGRGLVPASQTAPGVPWIIKRSALDDPGVQRAVEASKNYRPRTPSRNMATLRIPGT
jgi:DNA invertase Pin-like site-specific DNA recombinase